MSKTNTPFFGLDAHGSVGGSITAQGLSKETLVRTKPLPTYRYTLPQAYQRWLYKDYAYLWTQQSAATQADYRAAGVRFHLTGFQYWIKDMLTRLPDIAAWWKLDPPNIITTPDSSRNTNTGTVIGASPAAGIIDRCLYFDGINDYVLRNHTPTLDLTANLTYQMWVYPTNVTTPRYLLFNGQYNQSGSSLAIPGNGQLRIQTYGGGVNQSTLSALGTVVVDEWQLITATLQGATAKLYKNGIDVTAIPAVHIAPAPTTHPLHIGLSDLLAFDYIGYIDNVLILNRPLSQPTILRHSQRRYPP